MAKADIDYSKVKSTGHTLYLSEKPCNVTFMRGHIASYADESCLDDFLDMLADQKIGTVIVLLTDAQIKKYYDGENLLDLYRSEGINVIHYPIRDFSVPKDFSTFHKLIKELDSRLRKENVLIHCSAGWGRTGMVAAGLAIYKGHNPMQAINLIRRIRPGTIETSEQERFVRSYYSYKELHEELSNIFKF